ncbi:CBASS cGAMP-activated phospholipase [Desulfoferrobacter suflitae]|uniref:CBASS cGAMP-activated phospholipase n=1 Tax=Desulfoferrobacter suflitae TaxID=2865782 RepID=UPI0021642CE6|nr:CBASS cGAMP-activated phospholipase [Desulfoferrobacter suflitae]MCK8604374.1 patatin-like phospholipase family protein [Desulfoferrobacter suflitae]
MKILSIDGGGIKGIYSAAFLAGLEERFGKSIADCFDLIAGTSTGGILALALAARLPARDVVTFYREWGPKIFPTKLTFLYTLRSLLFSKYNNVSLDRAFKDVFKDLKLKDLDAHTKRVALCIPSINAITGNPMVFKTQHDPNLCRDLEYYLWQVALATSAAPVYFPLAKVGIPNSAAQNLFVDGGLWANNPSMVALVEAVAYMKMPLQDIRLLSVGNIKSKTTFSSNSILSRGASLWREKVINLTLEAQAASIDHQVELLFRSLNLSSNYIRVEEPITSQTHLCLARMDCAKTKNLNDLEIMGRHRADCEGVKRRMIQLFTEE